MNKICCMSAGIFLIFSSSGWAQLVEQQHVPVSAITYVPPSVEGGRFGDHIVAYCKAKYFSLKYNLPLLYKPFHLSDKLTLHYKEIICSPAHIALFKRHVPVTCESDIINNLQPGTLFIANMYTSLEMNQPLQETSDSSSVPYCTFFWIDEIYKKMIEEPEFGRMVRQMLQPIAELPKPEIPAGLISVALHVRRGGGFDGPLGTAQYVDQISMTPEINSVTTDKKFPLKFPPEQFFVDQLIKLSELLDDRPLYVQLFTDDLHAPELLDRLKTRCHKSNITWAYNPTVWKNSTLEEIYAMTHFDCLIRSCSHFGGIAQLLGNHKIVIWPTEYEWKSNYLDIRKTSVMVNNKSNRVIEEFNCAAIKKSVFQQLFGPTLCEKSVSYN